MSSLLRSDEDGGTLVTVVHRSRDIVEIGRVDDHGIVREYEGPAAYSPGAYRVIHDLPEVILDGVERNAGQ